MSVFRFFYALFLRIGGLGLMASGAVGLLLPGFAEIEGTPLVGALPFEANLGAVLLGLFLLLPWWLPRGLRRPDRTSDIVWVAPLAGASWLASAILVSAVRTLDPIFPTGQPLGPELDMAWTAGAFIAALMVTSLAAKGEPAQPVAKNVPPPSGETGAILSIHRSLLAFAGIAIAMCAFITGRVLLDNPPVTFPGISTGALDVQIGLAGLSVAAGLSLLFSATTPHALRRPTRAVHFFTVGIWLVLLILPVLAVFVTIGGSVALTARDVGFPHDAVLPLARTVTETVVMSVLSAPGATMAMILGTFASLFLVLTTVLVIRRPVQIVEEEKPLRPYSDSTTVEEAPEMPKKKDLRAGALPEPKLPAMGGIMKLYVAADWMVMRLLGAGLLGTGYLLWQMMEAGRELPQASLTYGFSSMHALIAYCTVGALLGVPFLLPRMIVSPRHVIGGLVKAGLILGAGLVVRPVVPTAINLLVDDKYHATLLYIAPYALNVVVGLAVAGALFTSFFRQLGKEPKTDYLGKPVVEMTPADLHRLREARMGLN